MKYTGPKFKRCRREQVNLFGSSKYNIKKRRALPGQHGKNMARLSEYGKLLRNKQTLKRSYLLSEKQFSNIVKKKSSQYSKNKGVSHDTALYIYLESRMDSIVYRAGFAQTIIQARQMVNHGHFLLNGRKHNIPSTFIKDGDAIELKDKLKNSPLYSMIGKDKGFKEPSWLKIDKNKYTIQTITVPQVGEIGQNADLLKAIEFYARV